MTNPKLSTTTSSSFDIDYVSPPKYKKTPLKLSHLFDSTPRYNDTSVFDKEAGNAMEIEYSAPSTPKQKTNSSLQSSPSSVSSNDSISTYTDDLEKMQLATDDFQIIQRAAEQFAEKSFEEVGDTVSKLAVKQKIDEFSQQQYDNKREIILEQYNKLRDTNDKILNKMKQIIGSHTSLSPDRKLEKALYNKSIRNTLENRIHQLECDIIKKNAAIREAEWYQNRVVKDPVKQSQNRAKIQYSKDMLAQMRQELQDIKTQLKDSTDNRINALQNERTLKMKNLQDEINAKLANDPDLRQLVRQRDNIQYMINTDNRRTNIGINTDPNGAKEALDNVKTLVEQHVNKLSEEGEC
jgi:DNA repair exonuclease SbcCD ATPase subunit